MGHFHAAESRHPPPPRERGTSHRARSERSNPGTRRTRAILAATHHALVGPVQEPFGDGLGDDPGAEGQTVRRRVVRRRRARGAARLRRPSSQDRVVSSTAPCAGYRPGRDVSIRRGAYARCRCGRSRASGGVCSKARKGLPGRRTRVQADLLLHLDRGTGRAVPTRPFAPGRTPHSRTRAADSRVARRTSSSRSIRAVPGPDRTADEPTHRGRRSPFAPRTRRGNRAVAGPRILHSSIYGSRIRTDQEDVRGHSDSRGIRAHDRTHRPGEIGFDRSESYGRLRLVRPPDLVAGSPCTTRGHPRSGTSAIHERVSQTS